MSEKLHILFISANPDDNLHLGISKERKKIENGLERYEGQFEFFNWDGIESTDLIHVLQKCKPHVLHFSGHASENGGIPVFLDAKDNGELVPSQAFVNALHLYKETIKCVFLNACYTYQLANVISEYLPCVIGSVDAVSDEAAIEFSCIFYRLIFETDIQDAFDKSVVHLQLQNKSYKSLQIKFNEEYQYKKIFLFAKNKDNLNQEDKKIKKDIQKLKDNYKKLLEDNLSIDEFWGVLFPFVNELLNGNNYKEFRKKTGQVAIDSLNRLLINLRDKIHSYRENGNIGDIDQARKDERLFINVSKEIIIKLDEI